MFIPKSLKAGYCVSDHLRAEANIEALHMAFNNSCPILIGLIHHSDRGSQYVDQGYQELLIEKGIHISMGLQAQDNAYAERINGIIKNEYLKYRSIIDLQTLKKYVKQAVKHYNEKRPHNSLPKRLAPKQFEKQLLNLSDQDTPMVIVYADRHSGCGNDKIIAAFDLSDFRPRKGPLAHDCPIVNN